MTRSLSLLLFAVILPVSAAVSRPDHPRIIINAEKRASLQAAATTSNPNWVNLKNQADTLAAYPVIGPKDGTASGTINSGYRGSGYYDALLPLALAYQITGSTSYSSKVIEIMKVIDAAGLCVMYSSSDNPCGLDSSNGYPMRFYPVAMAIGYDWVYDKLTSSQRTAFITQLNEYMTWCNTYCYQLTGPGVGNFYSGVFYATYTTGYATWPENPSAEGYIEKARSEFDSIVMAEFRAGGSFLGGAPVEGWAYGSGVLERYLHYVLTFEAATGEVLPTDMPTQVTNALLYFTKPNRWQIIDDGEWGGNLCGLVLRSVPLILTEVLNGTTAGAYAQWYYDNLATAPTSSFDADKWERFAFYSGSRPKTDYRSTLPPVYRSAGNELFNIRTDWTDSATWISYAAGAKYYIDHENRDGGSLTIQRGSDYLLVDGSQYRPPAGWQGSAVAGTKSANENTLYFNDLGEYLPTSSDYEGGQGFWGSNKVLAFESGANGAYIRSDLTTAYDNRPDRQDPNKRSLLRFERSFVHLPGNIVALFDAVSAKKSQYVKAMRFQFPLHPVISAQASWVDVGQSRLYVKTVYPSSSTSKVSQVLNQKGVVAAWRQEVANQTQVADDVFLHVLIPSALSGFVTPDIRSVPVETGAMKGAFVQAGEAQAILFNTSTSAVSKVKYSPPLGLAIKHHLYGMTPGGKYRASVVQGAVQVESDSAGTLVATSAGSLHFSCGYVTKSITRACTK